MSTALAKNLGFDPFDPARKNTFLVEWRVTATSEMAAALMKAQQYLLDNYGTNITVRQSCAADNFHITLNEFVLNGGIPQLYSVMELIKGFANDVMPRLAASAVASSTSLDASYDSLKIQLDGLKDFRQDTFFVALKGSGVDFLQLVYQEFHKLMYEAKILAEEKPKRDLTAHMTMGRRAGGGAGGRGRGGAAPAAASNDNTDNTWYQQLYADTYWKKNIGDTVKSDLGEIVFCARRHPQETQPPVIAVLFPPAATTTTAASSSAAAAASS